MFKYKTEAELTAMTAEQRDVYAEQKRAWEATQTKEQIEAAIKAIEFPKPEITKAEFEEVKETLNQVKEQTSKGGDKPESLHAVVKANHENIKKSAKKGAGEFEFVVKADTLRASVANNPYALDLPGIGQLAHRKLTVYDVFRKIPVGPNQNGTVRYVDWDDATKVRAAAAIAETGTFPESTAKWATYSLVLKKVGDSIPMSEEFAYDDAMFAAELDAFLRTNVAIKIDTDLLNADGTGSNILGLKAQVPTYTAVGAGIEAPTIYDLIVKMKEAISKPYGSKYTPDVAFMNITDINRYKLAKDANENYLMPPFVSMNGQIIDGITIIECNAMTANTLVLGDSRYGAIYEEPGVTVATAFSGTDFVEDMMTMKARKRLNLLIRTVDQTGWLECTDITAALAILDNAAS